MSKDLGLHYFFDFDGTLFNPSEGIEQAIRVSCSQIDLYISEESLREIISNLGPPIHVMMKNFVGNRLSEFVAAFRSNYDNHFCSYGYFYPRSVSTLVDLKKRYNHSLYLLTNKPIKPLKKILSRESELANIFSELLCIDYPHSNLPKAKRLANFISKHSISPSSCVVYGDTFDDFNAATTNDIKFVGFTKKDLTTNIFDFISL